MEISKLAEDVRHFAVARDWNQFHTPKNLAMALSVEAAELLELFTWLTPEESANVMENERVASKVRDELSDVLIYLVRLADLLDVDLEAAALKKIEDNAVKYPVEKARGTARKYSDL